MFVENITKKSNKKVYSIENKYPEFQSMTFRLVSIPKV